MRRRILILGASGFVARHLTRRLAREGNELHLVSRHRIPMRASHIHCYQSNFGDPVLLDKVLSRCDTVLHLASETTPGLSARHPAAEAAGLTSTLQLMECLQRFSDRHLIFLSSGGSVYGNPHKTPVDETAPLMPRSHYAVGKVALELFMQAFAINWSGRITVLRPANLYGPEQPFRPGFGVVRTLLQHCQLGTEMEVWGNGEAIRDYLYIDDMTEACVYIINNSLPSTTYNVGSMQGHSVNQLAKLVENVTGRTVPLQYREARQADVAAVVLDTSKLKMATGWSTRVGIEEGIARTWHWIKKNG